MLVDDVQKAFDDFEVSSATARGGHLFYNRACLSLSVDLEENAAFQNFLLRVM